MSEFIGFYLFLNSIPFLLGIMNGDRIYSNCSKPLNKIEYILPGYQVGCWLGTPFEKKK